MEDNSLMNTVCSNLPCFFQNKGLKPGKWPIFAVMSHTKKWIMEKSVSFQRLSGVNIDI